MIDYLATRNDFPTLIDALDCTTVAELGTGAGDFAAVLLRSRVPRLWMIDNWTNPADREAGYRDQAYRVAAGSGGRAEIIERDVMDWLRFMPDASVDFIYLDTAHEFEPAARELPEAYRVARRVLAGHDWALWNRQYNAEVGVVVAVEMLAAQHGLQIHVTGCPGLDYLSRLRAAHAASLLDDPGGWGCNVPSWWILK